MLGNWLKTTVLMAGIMALFGAVGSMLGGSQGMFIALLIGGGMNLWAYWFSDKMVLRMYNAHEVDETSAPQLYNLVRELAGRAGIPMPRVYLIDRGAAERLRHRAQPGERGGRGHHRHPAAAHGPELRGVMRTNWRT